MSCNDTCNFKWTLKHGVSNFMNEPIEVSSTNDCCESTNTSVDRFDLEQGIMEQTVISDDLDTLCSHILDNGIDVDKIVNILTGIAAMHRIKNDSLFDVYCQVFNLEG